LFKPGKGSSWASTSVQALAALVALRCFEHLLPKSKRTHTEIVLKAGTDNKAAESLGAKGSSTKIPLAFVRRQLSVILGRLQIRLETQWRPRGLNVEADDLTNLRTQSFCQDMQVKVSWSQLQFALLFKLVTHLESFHEEVS
jgi:hypothetical protein